MPISTKCLSPRKIVNPYTGEIMIVPCNHCLSCVMRKNQRYAFQCDLESSSHKYTLFITLTYSDKFIPRASFVDNITRPFGLDLFDKETGEFLGPCDMTSLQKDQLLQKFNILGDVPYLRKTDLQLFFKRLRYYISKNCSNEKVRYFAVGEYGPVHFRPHYHLLLFFDAESVLQACSSFVSASWPFGRVDCQISKGQCSSYVASYINSSVAVPKVFTLDSTRPFNLHSARLGQGFLKTTRSQVYESSPSDFVRQCVVVNGSAKEFNLWRSCYAYFYPKCRGFFNKSPQELRYAYTFYQSALKVFPTCVTCADLSREIASLIKLSSCDSTSYFRFLSCSDSSYVVESLLKYCYDADFLCDSESDKFRCAVNRLYNELLLSKHFLTFVCDHISSYEIDRKIALIRKFYSKLDYLHLLEFFDSQCAYYESDFVGNEYDSIDKFGNPFCPFFYDNYSFSLSTYKHMRVFKLFESDQYDQSYKRIKHKYLNDLNKIFIY